MRRTDDQLRFSPSDLAQYMESRFVSWMTRYDLERPGELTRDSDDPVLELIRRHGREHELSVLESLRAEGRRIVEIRGGDFDATRAALRDGADVIYQAALARGPFVGYCDFLLRCEGSSRLGPFRYEPLEAKSARHVKPGAVIQLACYAAMLEAFQGARVRELHLALGGSERIRLSHARLSYFFDYLQREFIEFHQDFDPETMPQAEPGVRLSPWETESRKRMLAEDGLAQVADITTAQIRRLRQAGIATRAALAGHDGSAVAGLMTVVLERLIHQARLQLASDEKMRPVYELLPGNSRGRGPELTTLPDESTLDVYFDLEGYPFEVGGLEYLWGAVDGKGFTEWWAFDAAQELEAFRAFMRWVLDRRTRDPSMHVYHYGAYETNVLKRLAARHTTLESELDVLLRQECFVDLYRVVRNGIRIGEPSYSLKNVERLYREHRDGDVETAVDSIVQYDRWMQSGEPRDWRRSTILAEIRRYNCEDCESTRELAAWLRAQKESDGRPAIEAEPERPESERRRKDRERRENLHEQLQASEGRRAPFAPLFAQLLEFHRREDRPAWWAFFDQRDKSEEQLIEDFNCLAGARYMRPARGAGNDRTFRYDFDPGQQTKIDAGSTCYVDGDLSLPVQVTAMELERGAVRLEFPTASWLQLERTAPRKISLIPRETYHTDTISRSILLLAQHYVERGELPQALLHYLERRAPAIEGHGQGPLVSSGETATAAVPRLCAGMRETALIIQGPPGSGKTTTAARAIVDLLKRGATVGVASNSHKAILNLLAACVEAGPESLRPLKAGGEATDPFFRRHPQIRRVTNRDIGGSLERHGLVGGTAWLFCRDDMAGRLDYLFVDEAGQVPLANLVGMSRAARNLVLVGDPVQLPQPTQGAHPGESGQSTLEYALDGAATIDAELGVFLDRSFRLHPILCRTISDAFYDGRLNAAPGRENRIVRIDAALETEVRSAGLAFVPVEHDGNAQSSPEEVEKIVSLVERLAVCEVTGLDGAVAGTLGHAGILVVAPYNLQVRALRRALPQTVRVGTVDRFQGQEAPVVLISMCASDATRSSRGLNFLLDPNRLNVALSRARCLAVVVGHPGLIRARARSVEQMERINLFCRILAEGSIQAFAPEEDG